MYYILKFCTFYNILKTHHGLNKRIKTFINYNYHLFELWKRRITAQTHPWKFSCVKINQTKLTWCDDPWFYFIVKWAILNLLKWHLFYKEDGETISSLIPLLAAFSVLIPLISIYWKPTGAGCMRRIQSNGNRTQIKPVCLDGRSFKIHYLSLHILRVDLSGNGIWDLI